MCTDRPGRPTGVGRTASGRPDPQAPPASGGKLDPRRWGDLPGELRTKLMQDVRASFGEDYTPTIKLYFQQIADTRKKK